ncbi:hypothetical protein [Candidatus Tisiphia endosymbiont of Sialis lutaria]|uniref:hypothetical protein n=1 Tax=Candidatus Tisiphia endosymbiont of Sialis lutaria TaxID=2029164 RepID=UPI00312CBEB1
MSKTVPIDYYRDLEDPECLNSQYYDDDKNFANLSTTLQFLHLAETMAEYGKEALEGKQLEAAKNFGFVTDHSNPDNSNPNNSWFTTVANAFSSIPKEHIFFATLLATSHAAHAYRHVTFNTPDNSNADNFDTENSNVVHHRSARAASTSEIWREIDLKNQCFKFEIVREKFYDWGENPQSTTLYVKCTDKPCSEKGNVVEGRTYVDSKKAFQFEPPALWLDDSSIGYDMKTVTTKYSFLESKDRPNTFPLEFTHTCHEPSSSTSEASSTTTSTTPEKITETSLTSLITEASTTKENSSTAMPKDNTTQAEPSTPTAPQDQTTPSAEDQGWLWNKVVAPIAETAAAVVTTAVIVYALHKLKQCYNKNKTKEELNVELKNCDEPSLLKLVDQIIPINDNDYTDGIKDLLVPLAGTGNLDSDLNSAAA